MGKVYPGDVRHELLLVELVVLHLGEGGRAARYLSGTLPLPLFDLLVLAGNLLPNFSLEGV